MDKKIVTIIGIILIIIGVGVFLYFNISTEIEQNVESQEEIEPEAEIEESQNNDTQIKLFFNDATSGILTVESRIVDAKDLIENPYLFVLQLLVKGPESSALKNSIPEGTKVNKVELKKGILYVDLSEEFLNSQGMNSIYAITNTVSQFNEIQSVKFTINGETKENIKEAFIRNE